jgi:hypothetical protein
VYDVGQQQALTDLGLDKDAGYLRDIASNVGAVGKQMFRDVFPTQAQRAQRAAAKAMAEAPLPALEAERLQAVMAKTKTGRLPEGWTMAPDGVTPVHISEWVPPSWMRPSSPVHKPELHKAAEDPSHTGPTAPLAPKPLAPDAPGVKQPKVPKPGEVGEVIPPPAPLKTAKAYRLSRRMEFRGLKISVETDKGESRHWYDPHNKEKGTTKMKYPYGYIRMTKGIDGDHVDVYVGPNENAKNVYVVHQQKAPNFDKYDEDKCMLGFNSADEAKKAYLDHYNDDRFFGSMTVMPFEQFKKKVLGTFKRPQKIAEQTMKPIQHAYKLGADQAYTDFMKEAQGNLGDPMFWQGGTPAEGEMPPMEGGTAEDAALALPPGIFQGLQTKVNPAGERSTTVKVTPEALGAPDTLAGIFDAEPTAKVEMSIAQQTAGGGGPADMGVPEGAPLDGAGAMPPPGKIASLIEKVTGKVG